MWNLFNASCYSNVCLCTVADSIRALMSVCGIAAEYECVHAIVARAKARLRDGNEAAMCIIPLCNKCSGSISCQCVWICIIFGNFFRTSLLLRARTA